MELTSNTPNEAYAYHIGRGILAKIHGKKHIKTPLPIITNHAIRRYIQPCKETISLIVFKSRSRRGLYRVQAIAEPIPSSARLRNCNKLVAVKLEKNCTSPDELLGSGASWAYSFSQEAIINALKNAANR